MAAGKTTVAVGFPHNALVVDKKLYGTKPQEVSADELDKLRQAAAANGVQLVVNDTTEDPALYDPSSKSADDVVAHLAAVDQTERDRILAAERTGKARKTILEAEPGQNGA